MQRRFFSEAAITSDLVKLSGPDAHHIVNVLRLNVGERIRLFDGSGFEFVSQIKEIRKKEVIAEVMESHEIARELGFQLTICVSLPKGDRQKILIEKLVEVGVSRVIPLDCKRSIVKVAAKSIEKMNRWVIEASKQCGRNQLMTIEAPISINDLVTSGKNENCVITHPYSADDSPASLISKSDKSKGFTIAIGPEGGFTDDEIELARNSDWNVVKLGPTILRIETAAVAAATIFGIGID